MKLRYTVLALLALAACEAPTTQRPTYTQAELKAEQQAQALAAKEAGTHVVDENKTYTHEEILPLAARLDYIAGPVAKASESLCRDMHGKNCDFQVVLDPSQKGLNAHADGQKVVVYPAMIDFAKNDNQLAFVIAHEFGHSIMGHIAAEQKNVGIGGIFGAIADAAVGSQGLETGGAFGKIGAQQGLMRYSAAFESEADYVGLYILARAGFKIEEAPDFWRLMSAAEPNAIYISTTHPNNPSRTIEMQKTVAEIRAKEAAHQPLIPNIAPRK